MPKRPVVIFLFAQEKLLFRYPPHNPFTIDVSNSNSNSSSTTNAPTAAPSSPSRSGHAKANGNPDPVAACGPTVSPQKETQQQQTPAGVGVRHKPRIGKRSQLSNVDSRLSLDGEGDAPRPTRIAPLTSSPATTIAAAAPLPPPPPPPVVHRGRGGTTTNSNGNDSRGAKNAAQGGAETCVGLQTTVLLHLLRASFSMCTTIQFAGGTFLIYPLLPNSVKSQRLQPSESWRSRDADEDEDDDEVKSGASQRSDGVAVAHRTLDVVLVVAMQQPDRENGATAMFVQAFMNVLVREELRSQYVTGQVLRMEQRLCAWEVGGGDDGTGSSGNTAGGGSGGGVVAGGCRPPAAEMFKKLLQYPQLSLCREIMLLAEHIMTGERPYNDDGIVTLMGVRSPTCGPLPMAPRRGGSGATTSTGNSNVNLRSSVGSATELVVHGLFSLPLTTILGRRGTPPSLSSAYVKQNPNYIVTLEDPGFVERLSKPYAEGVGRRASQLLPLAAIRTALSSLSLPWRIGELYRALERSFAEASQLRQSTKQQQQQQVPSISTNSAIRAGWVSAEGSLAHEASTSNSSITAVVTAAEEQNLVADGDVLAVEAVEFLRLSGALAVDAELTVVFTHGDLLPIAGLSRRSNERRRKDTTLTRSYTLSPQERPLDKPKTNTTVAPASLIGVMLQEGLRMSAAGGGGSANGLGTPFINAEDTPETPLTATLSVTSAFPSPTAACGGGGGSSGTAAVGVSDIPYFEVYCAWGSACPMCEELAAASYVWRAGGTPVRLSFPFLGSAVAEAARRRALTGPRAIDQECCGLLADQRPWFTRADPLTAPLVGTDASPMQLYRRLTRGHGDAAGQQPNSVVKESAGCLPKCGAVLSGELKRSVVGESEKFTVLTPDSITEEAQAWLAANLDLIRSRLNSALQQRKELEEMSTQLAERRRAAAAAAAEATAARACSGNNAGQQQQRVLRANQRYHKRTIYTPSSVPGELLPLSPGVVSVSHTSSPWLRPHDPEEGNPIPIATRLIGTERFVPFEALMQFVFHHTIALLWGKTGIHVETLLRLLERNLRRLRPFLTHYAYLRQLPTTTAPIASTVIKTVHTKSPAGSLCGSCPSSPSAGTTSERERHMEKKSEEEEEEEEAPLGLERQLQEAATVFTKLSLMDALKQLNGMSVEVVPTRLLLHAVVNAFSDVLLIGGGGGQSGVASSVR